MHAQALKACPLFKDFTGTGLQIFASVAAPKQFPKGAVLFTEDRPADALLIVVEGDVRLSANDAKGQPVPLGQLGAGDYLGELSLIRPGTRQCTATASSDVTALEIRHGDFQRLLASKPQACVKLLMAIVTGFGGKIAENRDALRSLVSKR